MSKVAQTAARAPNKEPAQAPAGKARGVGKGNLGMMDLGAYLRDHNQPFHEKTPRDEKKKHLKYFVLENG